MMSRKYRKELDKTKMLCEFYKQKADLLEEYKEYLPVVKDKKKKKVSNIMLAVSVIVILIYTIAAFVLQYHIGVEISPTLTTSVYAFFGGELLMIAGIRVSKIITGYDSNDDAMG